MSVAPKAAFLTLSFLAALCAGTACSRKRHLEEGPPLRIERIDASCPMVPGDPAAMARAMAARDGGVPIGVPGAQIPGAQIPGAQPRMPPGTQPGANPQVPPPVVPAMNPAAQPLVVVDAGAPAQTDTTARRRRRRR